MRQYPQGDLAAHLLGYVREVSPDQLEDPRYETLAPGDFVGQDGVEAAYDSLLRGVNGATRVQVDASGAPTGGRLTERDPRQGNDLVLSIDNDVQAAGQAAVGSYGYGGFVAMNIRNGELLGLGSAPSYQPSVLAKPLLPQRLAYSIFGDPKDTESLTGAPAVNRATQSAYPTGSIFKPITALARARLGRARRQRDHQRQRLLRPRRRQHPPQRRGRGQRPDRPPRRAPGLLRRLLLPPRRRARTRARETGARSRIGPASSGSASRPGSTSATRARRLVPDPNWRGELYARSQEPESPGGEEVVPDDVYEYGGTDRPWSVGDNINLAVGQGDLQANPLQMAVAYATIANGGEVVRPHVGLRVEDPAGRTIQEIEPAPRRQVPIEPEWQQAIMDGLHDAAMAPGGTSYPIFGGYPVDIAGKTGTAERPPNGDQSWYVALAPYDDPKYVVAVTIEQGGFGADTAAPGDAADPERAPAGQRGEDRRRQRRRGGRTSSDGSLPPLAPPLRAAARQPARAHGLRPARPAGS